MQDGRFRQVLRFDAVGHFFLPIQVQAQFALVLFGATDGLDGIIIGLGDAPVSLLEISATGLVKVGNAARTNRRATT